MPRSNLPNAKAIVFAALVAACTGNPVSPSAPSPLPSPGEASPAVEPSISATVAPATLAPSTALPSATASTPPDLGTRGVDEARGVWLAVEAAHVPLEAGRAIDLTLRIENRGARSVFWRSDGCEIPGVAFVELTDDAWIGGVKQAGIAAEFKREALSALGTPISIDLPSDRSPDDGGCADVGITHELRAGARLQRVVHWTGTAEFPIPQGPADIVAAFSFSQRRDPDSPSTSVTARLPTWIASDQVVAFIPPGPAMDVALADTAFRSWLEEADSSQWINTHRKLDLAKGTWEIGLFRDGGPGVSGSVTFDARTGVVLDHRFE